MPSSKNAQYRSSYLLFFPLLFVCLILEIVHLPAFIDSFRPNFTALLLIFFATIDPKRINVGFAWIAGCGLDLLTGAPLGINGLFLAGTICVILVQFKHFIDFVLWQQCLVTGMVSFIVQVIVYWLGHFLGDSDYNSNFIFQAIANTLMWPIVYGACMVCWALLNVGSADANSEKEL